MLALEFKRMDPGDKGHITERDFADLLIAYAGFTTKKKQKMLRRVKKFYDPESSPGISLKDYLSFYQVYFNFAFSIVLFIIKLLKSFLKLKTMIYF